MAIRLKTNPDHRRLPQIESGDYVILEQEDWSPYRLKSLVTNSDYEDDQYVCRIVAVVERGSLEPIRGDDPFALVNRNLVVNRKHIQEKVM